MHTFLCRMLWSGCLWKLNESNWKMVPTCLTHELSPCLSFPRHWDTSDWLMLISSVQWLLFLCPLKLLNGGELCKLFVCHTPIVSGCIGVTGAAFCGCFFFFLLSLGYWMGGSLTLVILLIRIINIVFLNPHSLTCTILNPPLFNSPLLIYWFHIFHMAVKIQRI